MGRKAKYSNEIKREMIKRYINGESAIALAKSYNMTKTGKDKIMSWTARYRVLGERMFESSNKNKSYSKELKQKVINAYLDGEGSFNDLANKYNISTHEIVRQWIIKYNQGIEIKDYDPKGDVYTMSTRKTTFEERIEIVKYVLSNNNDYKGAADKYSLPYANVYSWVKKYNDLGEDGLTDSRGRPNKITPSAILTNEERLKAENEKLKKDLERQKMVIEVLKKNIEIQERMERDSRLLNKKINTKR